MRSVKRNGKHTRILSALLSLLMMLMVAVPGVTAHAAPEVGD